MDEARIYAPVSLADVAAGISEHRPDYPELIDFIMDLDMGVADEDFTTQLISRLVIEFAEDTENTILEGVTVSARGPYNPAQEVEVAFVTLAEALADKDTNDVLRLLAEVLVIQRKRKEKEEDA